MTDFSITKTRSYTELLTNKLRATDEEISGNLSINNNLTTGSVLIPDNKKSLINLRTVSKNALYPCGTKYEIGSKSFRYVSIAKSTAVSAGHVLQSAKSSASGTLAQISASVAVNVQSGANTITFTEVTGVSAIEENIFANGTITIEDSVDLTIQSTSYKILRNTAAVGGGLCTLTLEESIIGNISISDEVTVVTCNYVELIPIAVGSLTSSAMGISMVNVTSQSYRQYIWIQTAGLASVIGESTTFTAGGSIVIPPTSTIGAVRPITDPVTETIIGHCRITVNISGAGEAIIIELGFAIHA